MLGFVLLSGPCWARGSQLQRGTHPKDVVCRCAGPPPSTRPDVDCTRPSGEGCDHHRTATRLIRHRPYRGPRMQPDPDRLLGALERRPIPGSVAPSRRTDVPAPQPSARGSLAKALLAFWRLRPGTSPSGHLRAQDAGTGRRQGRQEIGTARPRVVRFWSRPSKRTRTRQDIGSLCRSVCGHVPVVHLSYFDGIGIASEALRRINDNVLLTLSWEVNPGCIDFTTQHFHLAPTGDITNLIQHTRGSKAH